VTIDPVALMFLGKLSPVRGWDVLPGPAEGLCLVVLFRSVGQGRRLFRLWKDYYPSSPAHRSWDATRGETVIPPPRASNKTVITFDDLYSNALPTSPLPPATSASHGARTRGSSRKAPIRRITRGTALPYSMPTATTSSSRGSQLSTSRASPCPSSGWILPLFSSRGGKRGPASTAVS